MTTDGGRLEFLVADSRENNLFVFLLVFDFHAIFLIFFRFILTESDLGRD